MAPRIESLSVTSRRGVMIWPGYFSARSLRVSGFRAVAATRCPAARSCSVRMRPNPAEAPVMNQVLLLIYFLSLRRNRRRCPRIGSGKDYFVLACLRLVDRSSLK